MLAQHYDPADNRHSVQAAALKAHHGRCAGQFQLPRGFDCTGVVDKHCSCRHKGRAALPYFDVAMAIDGDYAINNRRNLNGLSLPGSKQFQLDGFMFTLPLRVPTTVFCTHSALYHFNCLFVAAYLLQQAPPLQFCAECFLVSQQVHAFSFEHAHSLRIGMQGLFGEQMSFETIHWMIFEILHAARHRAGSGVFITTGGSRCRGR
mmetsp:Transcript_57492/g.101026  ORF Transcript_57492/g.101026 Transcript_57492/m.101026 type:complete len:205 (-) Transcript_57492:163-777(-)